MTILVTGGAGYIGSHMLLELQEYHDSVIVLDNLSTGFESAIPEHMIFIQGNIADSDLVTKIFQDYSVQSVIHFAGSIQVSESLENPLFYYENNTANSRSLIEACVKNNVKNFIFSSTAAVYGNPDSVPISEQNALKPLSPYGSSKLMTEVMLQDMAAAYSMRYVALRYFNVAGADPTCRAGQRTKGAANLIKVACEAAVGLRPSLSVFGNDYNTRDGTGIRDYIHVCDLTKAHKAALDYLQDGGESQVLNCGYGQGYSVKQVIETVKKVSGVDFKVITEGRRDGDIETSIACNDAILKTLKWTPELDNLETIVTHALNWEKHLIEKS